MSENTPEKSTTGILTENLREILHKKESVCSELEKLKSASGIDYSSEIARLSDAFASAGELPPEFAELLEKRFADALKNARLVKGRREGKTVFYSLADDHVKTIIDQGLDHVAE